MALIVAGLATVVVSMAAQSGAPPSLAWQAVRNGPSGGAVTALVETSHDVVLANVAGLLYRSSDDGRTWVQCRHVVPTEPRPRFRPASEWLWHSIADDDRDTQLEVTDHRCEAFDAVPFPPGVRTRDGMSLLASGSGVLALTSSGVYRRVAGTNWAQTLSFVSNGACGTHNGLTHVLVVAAKRLYRSADTGGTWVEVPGGGSAVTTPEAAPSAGPELACPMVLSGNWWTLYSRGRGGLWRSTDNGTSWIRVFDGTFSALAAHGKQVWIQVSTTEGDVWRRSDDEGATWKATPSPPWPGRVSRLLHTRQGTLLAATYTGVFRFDNHSATWTRTGFYRWNLRLASDAGRSYALGNEGVWTSTDGGASWNAAPRPTVEGTEWHHSVSRVFDTQDGRIRGVIGNRLFVSADHGTTWRPSGLDKDVLTLFRASGTWYAGTVEGVFRSSDLESWVECSSGLWEGGPLIAMGNGDLIQIGIGNARSIDGCRSWWRFETSGSGSGARSFVFNEPSVGILAIGPGIASLDPETREWTGWRRADDGQVVSAARDRRGRYWLATRQGVQLLTMVDGRPTIWPMGLDGQDIVSLTVDPKGFLLASVRDRGLFRAALP